MIYYDGFRDPNCRLNMFSICSAKGLPARKSTVVFDKSKKYHDKIDYTEDPSNSCISFFICLVSGAKGLHRILFVHRFVNGQGAAGILS